MKKLLAAIIPLVISLQVPAWNSYRLPAEWTDTLQFGKRLVEVMYHASSAKKEELRASVAGSASAVATPLPESVFAAPAHPTGLQCHRVMHPLLPPDAPEALPRAAFHIETSNSERNGLRIMRDHELIVMSSQLEAEVQQAWEKSKKRLANLECELRKKTGKTKVMEIPEIRFVFPSV